jgi:hypothetical protein
MEAGTGSRQPATGTIPSKDEFRPESMAMAIEANPMREPGTIEKDVLFGFQDQLFLAGGDHLVFDYVTGKRTVEEASFANFFSNIERRKTLANTMSARFLHVIVPDKQSVLKELCPIPVEYCLGQLYLEKFPEGTQPIRYPLDLLRGSAVDAYLKTDTHLTDWGSVLVAYDIAGYFTGEMQSVERLTLVSSLTKEEHCIGDLGGRFDPPLGEIRRNLDLPPIRGGGFQNKLTGGNDGMADVIVNFDAKYQKRVLLFGDSFGRQVSAILCRFFQEVVFVRTPFVHEEILFTIQPDYVVSENVERYLDYSFPDENHTSFFMLPYLGGGAYAPDRDFCEAFGAVLSYPRHPYREFIARLRSAAG